MTSPPLRASTGFTNFPIIFVAIANTTITIARTTPKTSILNIIVNESLSNELLNFEKINADTERAKDINVNNKGSKMTVFKSIFCKNFEANATRTVVTPIAKPTKRILNIVL